MARMSIYLNFSGNTEEVFNFYKTVFQTEFDTVMRWGDMPNCDEIPKELHTQIMHISMPIDKHIVIAGADAPESMGHKVTIGNNSYIVLQPESKSEADRLFNELSAGGKVEMPMQDQFWGDYFGTLTDKFGIQWMIVYSYPEKEKASQGDFQSANI